MNGLEESVSAHRDPDADLSGILHLEGPEEVWKEVAAICALVAPAEDPARFEEVFSDTMAMYQGTFPGYQACNTPYHDLSHTLDTLLAAARLAHGLSDSGWPISPDGFFLALTAALLHDTGYLQEQCDCEGTGARYAKIHVQRSADFAVRYLGSRGFGTEDRERCRLMILCTDLAQNPCALPFPDPETGVLGKTLAVADVLGQMASRLYLEKLLLLYREFREGGVIEFASELDLLEKTRGFFELVKRRMARQCDALNLLMQRHFRVRWKIPCDPYALYMEKNLAYLDQLLANRENGYRNELRRAGIVKNLQD
ncbi:MAG: HD domain-containing protein [Thermodesulfobacteriota bacterium]